MKKKIFRFYIIGFYLLWIIYVFGFSPYLLPTHLSPLNYTLINLVARIIIWILPALIYLRIMKSQEPDLEIETGWHGTDLDGLLAGILVPLAIFFMNFFALGNPSLDFKVLDLNTIVNTILLVPIIEEFIFRGVIIGSIKAVFEIESPLVRNIITSTLFILIHIPGWILYSPNLPIYYPLSLFILSLILGYLVQRHKSLIPSIVVHSMNNIFSAIFWR